MKRIYPELSKEELNKQWNELQEKYKKESGENFGEVPHSTIVESTRYLNNMNKDNKNIKDDNRDKILEDLEHLQDDVLEHGFAGSNERELWLRESIADYIVENYYISGFECMQEQLRLPDVSDMLATVNTKIIISESGFKLPQDKGVIRFGDVLKSSMTHDVVVMFHEQKKKPIVKVLDEDIWFELEEFINSWGSRLEISHNVNYYGG